MKCIGRRLSPRVQSLASLSFTRNAMVGRGHVWRSLRALDWALSFLVSPLVSESGFSREGVAHCLISRQTGHVRSSTHMEG